MKKSLHFSMSPLLSAFVLFTLSGATWAHVQQKFVDCLSNFHSQNSSSSSAISKVIYTQTNSSYSSLLESTVRNFRFNPQTTPKPLVIVTPLHVSHIEAAIHCARKHGLQIRTRSGGHDFEGLSYISQVPFVIVDLVNLRSVEIDVENRVAWVESGAVLGELYYQIAEKSRTLAFPAGLCPTVGIGGYLSGGGYGLLLRQYGLATDNVIDAQLIDVKGRVLDRKSMGEDLFWAIRGGGGGSFGIVVAWKLQLVAVPSTVTVFTVTKSLEQNATKLVHRWQTVAPKLPKEVYFGVTVTRANSTIHASFHSSFLGGADELVALMQHRFPELGLTREDCSEVSWIESILNIGRLPNQTLDILLDRTLQSPLLTPSFKSKSDYVKEPMPETAFRGLWSRLLEAETDSVGLDLIAYGGIMDEIPDTATPFPHRAGNLYKIVYNAGWQQQENRLSARHVRWIRRLYTYMGSFVSKSPRQAYINYRDLDIGRNKALGNTSFAQASIWGRKYFMNNFDKLVRVKTMIDPQNFFRHDQSIPPFSH